MEKDNKIPWTWIGNDVLLYREGASDPELATLEQVSELGVAYAHKSGEVGGETIFVPWNAVGWMRPPVAADLEDSEAESQE